MDTFETAMVENLAEGLDLKGTGATLLFQSTTLNEDNPVTFARYRFTSPLSGLPRRW